MSIQIEPAKLTYRESQIAFFASMGYSARYIAERFTISKRTVEVHLGHIYQKTGVSTRDDFIDYSRGVRNEQSNQRSNRS